MSKHEPEIQFIARELNVILVALGVEETATDLQKGIIESTLLICHSQGIIDYLESKLDDK